MAELIPDHTACRIRNHGETKLRLQWDGDWYEIMPGKDGFAPYNAICLWFGDPRAIDIGDPDNDRPTQYRRAERERLSTFYGIYEDPWYDESQIRSFGIDKITDFAAESTMTDARRRPVGAVPYVPDRARGFRHPNLPSIEVWRVDTDEKLWTVVEDPEGSRNAPVDTTKAQNLALKSQIDQMEAQLARMKDEMLYRSPEAMEVDLDEEPSIDQPGTEDVVAGGGDILTPDASSLDDDPEVAETEMREDRPRVSHTKGR